ncbi:MAG: DMT family transporter [Alphaproteobacteria bacterium]|nr:DMT family transporter [Alphaproteobacteria bacterium]
MAWLWRQPYLLLVLAALFWAGNMNVGRAVSEFVPPVALAFCRWFGASLIFLPLAWPHLRRDWPAILRGLKHLMLFALLGVAAFNALLYLGLQSTTTINAALINSTTPPLVVAVSFLLLGARASPRQALGILCSLLGVAVIITRGDLTVVLSLDLSLGDLWLLLAMTCYAVYTVLLKDRPPMHPFAFAWSIFFIGAMILVPVFAWEMAAGRTLRADLPTGLAIGYVSIFPSILSYLCWNRGVDLIGPNRAAPFVHLVTVFAPAIAMTVLGERLHLFHVVGAALVGAGIFLATRPTAARARGAG